jgi:hypothetical protein
VLRFGIQAVDVWCLIERAAIASHVLPAHIVDQDEVEIQVWLSGILRQGRLARSGANAEKEDGEPGKKAQG